MRHGTMIQIDGRVQVTAYLHDDPQFAGEGWFTISDDGRGDISVAGITPAAMIDMGEQIAAHGRRLADEQAPWLDHAAVEENWRRDLDGLIEQHESARERLRR